MDSMREFFYNAGGYYCPPKRDLTARFCKDVLQGKKKLLKLNEVKWVEFVP